MILSLSSIVVKPYNQCGKQENLKLSSMPLVTEPLLSVGHRNEEDIVLLLRGLQSDWEDR